MPHQPADVEWSSTRYNVKHSAALVHRRPNTRLTNSPPYYIYPAICHEEHLSNSQKVVFNPRTGICNLNNSGQNRDKSQTLSTSQSTGLQVTPTLGLPLFNLKNHVILSIDTGNVTVGCKVNTRMVIRIKPQ